MEKRLYFGIDLNVDYADLIRREDDPVIRSRLFVERRFKIGCFVREREFFEGMWVVDRNLNGWQIKKIEGERIEDMTFLVQDQDGKEESFLPIEVVDLREVELESKFYALQFAICAAVGIRDEMPVAKRPEWFHVVDTVLERDGR